MDYFKNCQVQPDINRKIESLSYNHNNNSSNNNNIKTLTTITTTISNMLQEQQQKRQNNNYNNNKNISNHNHNNNNNNPKHCAIYYLTHYIMQQMEAGLSGLAEDDPGSSNDSFGSTFRIN